MEPHHKHVFKRDLKELKETTGLISTRRLFHRKECSPEILSPKFEMFSKALAEARILWVCMCSDRGSMMFLGVSPEQGLNAINNILRSILDLLEASEEMLVMFPPPFIISYYLTWQWDVLHCGILQIHYLSNMRFRGCLHESKSKTVRKLCRVFRNLFVCLFFFSFCLR